MVEREIFYCMNCKAHFYLSEEETKKFAEMRHHLNEARDFAVELGLKGKWLVPSTGALFTNKAKCCDNPYMTLKLWGMK